MPNTRPGIKFDKTGVCFPCRVAEKRKKTDWEARKKEFDKLCNRYRRNDGKYDCVVPVSGGKDSHYQVHIMKDIMRMNPLLICVSDSFGHTKAGDHNIRNISEAFGADIIVYNLNHKTMRSMVKLAFEKYGSPTWPIDLAIYSVPIKLAAALGIKLIVYGENIAYEYGGPGAIETYSAKMQIKNDVVKSIDWNWWYEHGIKPEEVDFLKYPSPDIVDVLEPIYLSYFFPWDGMKNYLVAKRFGFRDANGEWDREGFIENFDQIDSFGYIVHPWLKYPKYGHARATDVSCYWIRNGYITREEGIRNVKENDHKLDPKALDDFLKFTGYTDREFWAIVDKFYNRKIFESVDGEWRLKNPIWNKKNR